MGQGPMGVMWFRGRVCIHAPSFLHIWKLWIGRERRAAPRLARRRRRVSRAVNRFSSVYGPIRRSYRRIFDTKERGLLRDCERVPLPSFVRETFLVVIEKNRTL